LEVNTTVRDMQPKHRRLVALAGVAVVLLVVGRLWPLLTSKDASNDSSPVTATRTSSVSGGVDLESTATTFKPGGSSRVAQPAPNFTNISRQGNSPALRLSATAPLDLQVGQVSDIRIDLQADGGVRELMFDVAFDKKRLALRGSSEGNLIQQSGVSETFTVEEPSDGNVHVSVKAGNTSSLFGNGTVAVLYVEAIKDETSQITLQNVSAVESGGATDSAPAVLQGSIVAIH
jgi:hypothetical protein